MSNQTKRISPVVLWLRVPTPLPASSYKIASDTGMPYSSVARVMSGATPVPARFLTLCAHVYGLSLDQIAMIGPSDRTEHDHLLKVKSQSTPAHASNTGAGDTYSATRTTIQTPSHAQLRQIAAECAQLMPWQAIPLAQAQDPEPVTKAHNRNPHAPAKPDTGSVEHAWWRIRRAIRRYGQPTLDSVGVPTGNTYPEPLRDAIAASWTRAEGWPEDHPWRDARQQAIRDAVNAGRLPDYSPPAAEPTRPHKAKKQKKKLVQNSVQS